MTLIEKTLVELLAERVGDSADKIGITFDGTNYTWKEIDRISSKLAILLKEEGIKPRDHVALLGTNSGSWILHYMAIIKVGAVAVLLNNRFKEVELFKSMQTANVSYLIYSNGFRGMTYDKIVGHFGKDGIIKKSIPMVQDEVLLREYGSKDWDFEGNKLVAKDTSTVLFTSGTTGDAKAVPLSFYNLINNGRAMVNGLKMTGDDVLCLSVPLFHCFGITACIIVSLITGAHMVVLEDFKSVQVCEAIEKYKCTILNGVPSMFLAIMQNPDHKNYDLSSLRKGIIAGSAIYHKDFIDISKAFPNLTLLPSYGQTESSPCVSFASLDDDLEVRARYSGKVIDGVEVRLVDLDTGKVANEGEYGEIQVKGYNVMEGYIGAPKVDLDTFTEDGWLKTGDLGRFSDDGYLEISGRCKNIIIRGGENISPIEIENYIRNIVGDKAIKVIGIPADIIQEEIVAVIEGKEDDELRNEIRLKLREQISGYKVPRYIVFIEEFPMTASGKIDEKSIKKIVVENIKKLYIFD